MMLCGDMLDIAYQSQLEGDFRELLVDSDVFGIGFFGDGAIIHKYPLVNVFVSSFHVPAMIVNIVDCSKRLQALIFSSQLLRHWMN